MANCGGDCGSCGNCASCGGCARELVLTEAEVDFLLRFAQIPFLPVVRKMGEEIPVFREENAPENASVILQCLEKKALISIDYAIALKGFDYAAYPGFPIRGSMALTERGHTVLELLERQGMGEI